MINENQKKTTQEYRDNYDRIFRRPKGGNCDSRGTGCPERTNDGLTPEHRKAFDKVAQAHARKGKQAKPTQPHRDKTKYHRPDQEAYDAFKKGEL